MAQRKVYWRADIPRQVTLVRSRCGLVSCYPAHRNCSSGQLALMGEYQQARQECEDREPQDETFSPHTEFERYGHVSQAPETLDSLDVIELKLLFLAPGVYDRRWSRW